MTDINSLPFHLQLLVREYGHSTYQLIQGLRDIEDVAERTRRAAQIVQLILRLQPALREQPEIQERLWSHVNALAGGDVELDAPVPLKNLTARLEKPGRVPYPVRGPKLRAYGAAVEALIAKALTLEDEAEREQAGFLIGRTMKFLFRQHNKENAKDITIIRHLAELSDGKLKLDPAVVDAQNLFEMNTSGREATHPSQPTQARDTSRGGRRERTGKSGKKRRKSSRQEPQQPPQ